MLVAVVVSGLTDISLGLITKFLPICLISSERVAEKNKVCLIFGSSLVIFSISGIKPISSILSASSMTRILTSFNITFPLSMWSRSLPGVATSTSTPLASFPSCSENDIPPISSAIWSFRYLLKILKSSETCIASSLVGASINDLGIRDLDCPVISISTNGIIKDAVLPVPVWAHPSISLPIKT